jgi:hypothetical protein
MVRQASDHLNDTNFLNKISKEINLHATGVLKEAAKAYTSEIKSEAIDQAMNDAKLEITQLETKLLLRTKLVDGLGQFVQSGRAGL